MKNKGTYVTAIFVLALLTIAFTFLNATQDDDMLAEGIRDSIPTRRQLRRSFFEKRAVLVVYGASEKAISAKYQALLTDLARSPAADSWRNISVSFKEASRVKPQELTENIVYLVGTPKGNPLLTAYEQKLPLSFGEKGFTFQNQAYPGEDMLFSLGFYPNPGNDTLPLSVLSGNDEEKVFEFFSRKVAEGGRSFFRQPMDYEVYKGNRRIVLGDFSEEWGPDKSTHFDFSTRNNLVHTSEHFEYISHNGDLSLFNILSLSEDIEGTFKKIIAFTGRDSVLPRITYHIYQSAEEKGLMTGNTNQASFDRSDHSVHTVINAAYEDNFIEAENSLLTHTLLGEAGTEALDRGLPVYFTKQWQREGYRYWTARLFESGNALTLQDLLHTESLELESPLIADCLSASLVAYLVRTWGKEAFLDRYASWKPGPREIAKLEAGWQSYLEQLSGDHPRKERALPKLPFLKGFNFAHEGYSIYNGYGSGKAAESLQKQRAMGSNAVALIPYSFIRDKNRPTPFRFSDGAGSENDEGVVQSAYDAQQLGMVVVLKPQVFAGDSWPGAVEMKSGADWNTFFEHYHRWIRHYALLAEIHQLEVLSVGVEFAKATLSHEDEWRELFRNVRGLYQGNLTYAANWGAEFEKVGFWDELDFIGLNCYYPLSKGDNPTKEELTANFDSVKTRITRVYEKFNKPIVFTEIGFRSIDTPWKNPHAEGDDSFNEAHQQLCYEVVFEGIEGEPWCGGILWWKYPSYLEYRGLENGSFTPNHKLAEGTVRTWFRKLP